MRWEDASDGGLSVQMAQRAGGGTHGEPLSSALRAPIARKLYSCSTIVDIIYQLLLFSAGAR